ncbi:CzcE family metal-binding protein [Janthinobacterium sp. Mn2066]|uniref:CzcE family metal-binding protein n=1 Tax=Janthinobacterium sp. Mn2066 TaxID=3395264 RepID=UPI003BDB71BC
MLTLKKLAASAAIAALSSIMLAPAAQAQSPTGGPADYGMQVAPDTPARVVNIDATTTYVNVEDGETVKFNVDGKSFVWHFDTYPETFSVKLSRLAPAGIAIKGVTVYIDGNPLYLG